MSPEDEARLERARAIHRQEWVARALAMAIVLSLAIKAQDVPTPATNDEAA